MSRSFKPSLILHPLAWAAFLFLAVCMFRFLSGPFYLGSNSDPSYFYFYNFLSLCEGQSCKFVDHPGTTLDMLGAVVTKLFLVSRAQEPSLPACIPHLETILFLVWLAMLVL